MKKLLIYIISLIIFLKVNFNGVGFFGISLWFYLIAISFVLLIMFLKNKKIIIDKNYLKYLKLNIVFLILMFLVMIFNDNIQYNYMVILRYLFMIIFSILVYLVIQSKNDLRVLTNVIIFSVMFSSIFGILQQFYPILYESITTFLRINNDNNLVTGRISGLSTTSITFSYELVAASIICFSLFTKENRYFIFPILAILLFALFVNQTRSAIIAVIFGFVLISSGRHSFKKAGATLLILLVFVLGAYFLINNLGIESRFFNDDVSSSSRIPMIYTALEYSLQFPFGTGVYDLSRANIDLSMYPATIVSTILTNYTHNQFTNVLVEFGFLGLFTVLNIYTNIYKKHVSEAKFSKYNFLWIVVIIGYTINSLTHNGGIIHADPVIWLIFGIFYKHTLIK